MSRRTRRLVLITIAAVIAVNLLLSAIASLTHGPGGRPSSSYATQPKGFAAYADLLRRFGHPTAALLKRPAANTLDPSTTVMVLDPVDITQAEARSLRRFAVRGGHLVAGGPSPEDWLGEIVTPTPRWSATGRDVQLTLPGGGRVLTAHAGSWVSPGAASAAFGPQSAPLVLASPLGHGRLTLVADSSPLQNRGLAQGDNAALALALAGEPGRPVRFAETLHGYGVQRGLGALPLRWRIGLLGLALAALLWLAAHVRRLGAAEDPARPLPPPRRAYVEAIANALSRSGDPQAATEAVRSAAVERIASRAALGPDPGEQRLADAAARLGMSSVDVEALRRRPRSDADVLAIGRALTHSLERDR